MNGERSFVVLKAVNKVPTLAGCTNCQVKFFTPQSYARDSVGAEEHLRLKFSEHKCQEEQPRRRGWS